MFEKIRDESRKQNLIKQKIENVIPLNLNINELIIQEKKLKL